MGAAPVTPAMVTAGLKVADEVAAQATTTTTTSATTSTSTSTSTSTPATRTDVGSSFGQVVGRDESRGHNVGLVAVVGPHRWRALAGSAGRGRLGAGGIRRPAGAAISDHPPGLEDVSAPRESPGLWSSTIPGARRDDDPGPVPAYRTRPVGAARLRRSDQSPSVSSVDTGVASESAPFGALPTSSVPSFGDPTLAPARRRVRLRARLARPVSSLAT